MRNCAADVARRALSRWRGLPWIDRFGYLATAGFALALAAVLALMVVN